MSDAPEDFFKKHGKIIRFSPEQPNGEHHQSQGKQNGPASNRRFHLIRSKDVELGSSPYYLVHGLIPREGLILVWGPPKCGKSFWAFDLLMHVPLGRPYRGHRVEQGTVVYIACEGERGLAARNAAFRQRHLGEDDDPSFYLLTTRLNLPDQVDELALDIAAQIPREPIGAIALDTLNRSLGGSESKDEDMSRYVAAADTLRDRFKCAIVIIHHCGVDATRPRGHTSLTGAVDAQLAIKRDAADRIITTIEWMKDGPEGDDFVSRLETVQVGIDDNSTPISSCVVVADDCVVPAGKARQAKRPSLPPAAKIAFKQLKNAVTANGEPVPSASGVPKNTVGVRIDLWRRCAYQGGISEGESKSANRNAFNRAQEKLVAEEFVGVWGEWAWIC